MNSAKQPDYARLVYVTNKKEGYVLARLVDIGSETLSVELVEQHSTDQNVLTVSYNEVVAAQEDQTKSVDDNCALMYLNEATLLHNCRLRYLQKQIYTYVAHILIAINPYETLSDLYGEAEIKRYAGKSLGALPPHIFAIADKAYREMRQTKQSQSIVVSGESGAGKTESQKAILRYLCHGTGESSNAKILSAGAVEQRILETNPILEAFGNAKTLRNNNSSRFGKFVEIHFDSKFHVAGAHVSHYLLEKTRVCGPQNGERNFHVFYQLFANPKISAHLGLNGSPGNFRYLKNGCTQFFTRDAKNTSQILELNKSEQTKRMGTLKDSMVDDVTDFLRLSEALLEIGLNGTLRDALFETLGGILHLGNVEFVENFNDSKGGSRIDPKTMESLNQSAKLLGLEASQLQLGLISRMMQPTKAGAKGTLYMVPLKPHAASAARDALAKAIYSRLFDFVVTSINTSANKSNQNSNSTTFIGVLDIAGFEFFEINSFEQFCVNYCNEKLQQFFNDQILKQEQELYASEGLNVARIDYSDNYDCIELFEMKINGLLDSLDEEARLPRPSPQHFTSTILQKQQKHPKIMSVRKSNLRAQVRGMNDDDGFVIRHYAADVVYRTAQFLDKNNDALHVSLEMLLAETSTNVFIVEAFGQSVKEAIPLKGKMGGKKLTAASVGSKFRTQLLTLIQKLTNTGTHFVRCIKPNAEMSPSLFEGAQILDQLKCAGMGNVLKLMHRGFPSRTSFSSLFDMYRHALSPQLARLDPRSFCKCLFHALGLNDADYKFGLTKVFFGPGKFAEFDQLMKQDPENMRKFVDQIQVWIHHIRWRKAQYGVLSCIKLKNKIIYRAENLIKIQSALRAHIARSVHRPRILAFNRSGLLERDALELRAVAKNLNDKNLRKNWVDKIEQFSSECQNLKRSIKTSQINASEGMKECSKFQIKFDLYLKGLKEESKAEESRLRIQKIQEESLKQKEIEENRKREEQLKILEEEKSKVKESNAIEEEIFFVEEEEYENEKTSANPILPVSSWPYTKLRLTINTSKDEQLIKECRTECQRRLISFGKWKTLNKKLKN